MSLSTWILLIVLGVIVLLFTLIRPRSNPQKYPEVIQYILYDVRMNQALVETFLKRDKPKTFERNNWEINKSKISFLTETQKELLKETFGLIDEFNVIIKAAKKSKSDSYKILDLARLKVLLDSCQKELEDWMVKTTGQKEIAPKYPSMWSTFFGER